MFKRNLCTLVATIALTSSLMMPVKKAEAGVLIGGAGGIALAVAGITYGALCSINCTFGSSYNAFVISLIILDENEQPSRAFDTIPSYLLQELQDQASLKAESINFNSTGLKDVVFTHAEVDELFELADDETSLEQLENLREVLTKQSL